MPPIKYKDSAFTINSSIAPQRGAVQNEALFLEFVKAPISYNPKTVIFNLSVHSRTGKQTKLNGLGYIMKPNT